MRTVTCRSRHFSVLLVLVTISITLCGCFRLGPNRLDEDQTGYSRALTTGEKRQTLLNIVRLRYGDTPTFLDPTQVISAYQVQRSLNGGFQLFPSARSSTYLAGGGTIQMQESPTFTFQPVTGDAFAESFLRPLALSSLLPLALGGLPIDVLFRLSLQRINRLQNASSLSSKTDKGSPDFYLLIHDLRLLQVGGLLDVKIEGNGRGRIYLSITTTSDPDLRAATDETKQLLGMRPRSMGSELVFGTNPYRPGQISILSRSMLGILSQVAFQVEVPRQDIETGLTLQTVNEVGREKRPVIIIHSGMTSPKDAFTSVEYNDKVFWVNNNDFDSKLAFTTLQILLALAKTSTAPNTVVTIPAG